MKPTILLFAILFMFSACGSDSEKVYYAIDPNNRTVEVEQVKQAHPYTYLRVKENRDTYWMAVSTMEGAEEGMKLHFTQALEMTHFYSKELERTFDKILFVSDVSNRPVPLSKPSDRQAAEVQAHEHARSADMPKAVNVQPREGSLTIAELYANKTAYSGKSVKVTGEITRYNPGIMNRNWIHIQDGTADGNHFDLTVTSQDQAAVGDQVVVEGMLVLDKDFGAGYFYELIVEEASVSRIVSR